MRSERLKIVHGWKIILLMPLLLWGCGSSGSHPAKETVNSPSSILEEKVVEVIEVHPSPLSYTIEAVGSLKTIEDVILSPKRSGIIKNILVKEGDRVRRGQVLVQLDDVDARLQVERAEALLKQAETTLETDQNILTRYQRLLEMKVIPQQTYDDLKLRVKLDEVRLELAKTELEMAKQNLLDHQIVSPIEGMVDLKIAALGEHVNVAPKDQIMRIVQMDPLELEFYIPENRVGRIRIGSRIQFTLKAFTGETFFGTLQYISPTVDPVTRNVKMKAHVKNSDHRLKPGFFAEVTIQAGQNPSALIIPESALISQEGKFYTFTIEDGIARRHEVEIGVRSGGKVEILKGIQHGDCVVIAGHEQISDGTKVKIHPRS